MKYLYITLLFCFSLGTAFAQDAKKDYTEALQLVEVWLDAQKDFDQLPGLSAIVVEDQGVLWSSRACQCSRKGKHPALNLVQHLLDL